MPMARACTPQKPTPRQRVGAMPEGRLGSTVERGRRGEQRQERGRPHGFLAAGRSPARQADGPWGVGAPQRPQRTGEPSTGGRGGRGDGVLPGNVGRTGRAGFHTPPSLRVIACSQTAGTAEASRSEEPGAGQPHAGIGAGSAGQLASLPRREAVTPPSTESGTPAWDGSGTRGAALLAR